MPSAKIYIFYIIRNYYQMHLVETQFYEAVITLKPSYKANDIRCTDFSETQTIIVKASGRPQG
jgi:hypothetical protein